MLLPPLRPAVPPEADDAATASTIAIAAATKILAFIDDLQALDGRPVVGSSGTRSQRARPLIGLDHSRYRAESCTSTGPLSSPIVMLDRGFQASNCGTDQRSGSAPRAARELGDEPVAVAAVDRADVLDGVAGRGACRALEQE